MKTKILLSIILFCYLPSFLFSQGTWTQKADFWGVGRYAAVGFSISNKGYIGCGSYNAGGWQYLTDFWEYDSSSDTWTQKANFAGDGRRWGVSFTIGLKGYVGTGWSDSSAYLNDFWEYDPSINTWTQKANVGGSNRHAATGFSIGNKGYIMSGYGGGASGFLKDVWEYDPNSNIWTQKASLPCPGKYYPTGFSIGNKGYFGMGADSTNNPTTDFWEYDPSINIWTQKANYASPTQGVTSFSIGYKGFIIDGNNTWEYDQFANQWNQKANYIGGEGTFKTGFSIGTKGYVCDQNVYFSTSLNFYEFNPQDSVINLLRGSVFTDANSNCIMDGSDAPLNNWFVQAACITSGNVYYGSANATGNYEIWVPADTYSVSIIPKQYYSQACPVAGYNITVTSQDTASNLSFGIQVSDFCPDIIVSTGTAIQRRCFSNNYYNVQYWNNGTVAALNSTLSITFDNNIIPLSSTVPWSSVSGSTYSWNISSVQPGEYVSFSIQDSVSCDANLGDTLFVSVFMQLADDCDKENNSDESNHIVTGSFDPNAKEVFTTTNKINIKQADILATDTINYTIHFQNTGTDTAFTVVIFDTLDIKLNPASVISGVSSHPYTMQLLGQGVLKWTFNNILLPDSNINEPASHGFVKFVICQKPDNPDEAIIKNHAAIVFDFNVPVITDTVVLVISPPAAVNNTGIKEMIDILLYPNPSSDGHITLQYQLPKGEQYGEIILYDVQGAEVKKYKVDNTFNDILLDNTMLPAGTYFYQLQTGKGSVGVKKMVVVK